MTTTLNQQKGTAYEVFIKDFLKFENPSSNVWMWKDIPEIELRKAGILGDWNEFRLMRKENLKISLEENKLPDTGIDVFMKNLDESYVLIQCKNYDKKNYVKLENLSGFFMLLFITRTKNTRGIVYYTSKLSSYIKDIKPDENLAFIKKLFDKDEINNDKIITDNQNIIDKAYDYQIEAYNEIKKCFKSENRGILQLPCGLGKTLISMMVGLDYEQIIILSPLKQYCIQNLDRYLAESRFSTYKSLIIDSDETRDIEIVENFVKKNKKFILSVCFKSVDVIMNIFKSFKNPIFIIDEWHNISKNDVIYSDENSMSRLLYSDARILFMSATPRLFNIDLDDFDEINNELFGNVVYSYNMGNAIKNKLISDYQVFLPDIEINNNKFITDIKEEVNLSEFDNDLSIKCNFIMRGMLETGARKCIMYARTHEEAENLKNILITMKEYFSVDLYVNTLLSKDNKPSRILKIDEFTNFDGFSILVNVEILNECIDIKSCDSVYITYCSISKIKNIQRICRANRIDTANPHKISKIFLWANEYDECTEIITHLKEFDNSFVIQKVNIFSINNTDEQILNRTKNEIKYKTLDDYIMKIKVSYNWTDRFNNLIEFINNNKRIPSANSNNDYEHMIGIFYARQKYNYSIKVKMMAYKKYYDIWTEFIENHQEYFISHDEHWINNLNMVKTFIINNNKLPSRYSKDENEKYYGDWVATQKTNYKNNIKMLSAENHSETRRIWEEFLEEYKDFFKTNDEKWLSTFDEVKKFIIENNKKPSPTAKDDKIKVLGIWITTQNKNYQAKTQIMAQEEYYDKWTEFINEFSELFFTKEEIWKLNLNKVIEFMDKYNKRPNKNSLNAHEKTIGNWLTHQISYLKKGTNSMNNEELKELFINFTEKYKI